MLVINFNYNNLLSKAIDRLKKIRLYKVICNKHQELGFESTYERE